MMSSFPGTRWIVAATLLLAVGCTGGPRTRPVVGGPVAAGTGSLTEARKYLEGEWILESFEVFPPGRPPISVKGTGILIYDEFGNMRMELRTDQATGDALRPVGIDVRDGVMSTEGRTAVDLQNRTLTYVLEGQPPAAPGGPLALNRPRHWEVAGSLLTLTTRGDDGKPLSVGRWRKR